MLLCSKFVALVLLSVACGFASSSGSVFGQVEDPSGAAIPGVQLTLIDTGLKTEFKAVSGAHGLYSFPSLPVGHYDLTISAKGFRTQRKTNLAVDTDAALR